MTYSTPRFLRAALAALVCVLGSVAFAAEAKKSFDIPATEALPALKQFVTQSGEQLLYSAEAVTGVTTAAVKGTFTPREALDQMVKGTELSVIADRKNGALSLVRAASPNAHRAAQMEPSDRPGKIEDGKLVLDVLQVTGSRLKLNSGDSPVQPVFTLTARDIERTGASRLGDLFQYIPGVTSYSTGTSIEKTTGGLTGGGVGSDGARTSAQLRGGTLGATLLLVDGKRVPLTGQQNGNGQGLDLGGIPLSAVERVEVLLDGASAIYGADAIYGVINVILKKNYSGTEIRLTYDNTFDKDAGQWTTSLTHGFAQGRFSGLVSVSTSENNIMLQADRAITASLDRTLYGGSNDGGAATSRIGGTGSLSVASGNLPGLTTRFVAIPAGSDGQNVSIADYAAAGTPGGAIPTGRSGAMAYVKDRSGYLRLNFEFSEHLSLSGYVRMGHSRQRDNGSYRRAQGVTLPAGYPGNPFGVPVRLNKIFYDVTPQFSENYTRNNEIGVTAGGKVLGDWRYEASVNYLRGVNQTVPFKIDGIATAINSSGFLDPSQLNAAIATGRRPSLAYDSQSGSRDPNAIVDLFFNNSPFVLSDLAQTWTYAANVDGSVFNLPGGKIRVVAGAELREEYIDFPQALGASVGASAWSSVPQRGITAAYAEVKIPLVSPGQKWSWLNQFDLNLAVRTEDYSDVGRSTTPRYGAALKPLPWLLFRGSYGEGFLVPLLNDTNRPITTSVTPWFPFLNPIDSLRGNQNLTGQPYIATFGGNPGLKPQRSENITYGLVIDVPRIKGLSFSLDYYDNKYFDRFGSVSQLADLILYLPQTITRGANLPGDPAGWAGPITAVDQRIQNIALARVAGYSFGVRLNRTTPWGDITFSSAGEKFLRDEARITPGAAPTATTNKKFRPMRITTSLFWSHGPWEAGAFNIYGGRYWANSTNEALSPSRYTDDVMRWDARMSYDFGKAAGHGERGGSWWRRALHDTKWSVTVINVADTEPPIDAVGYFSSSVIDARLRRYIIDITKRF